MNFFAELKRRQMFRAAAAYAVVAWVLLQLVNNLTPALRLPEWAAALVVVLIVVGFPIVLLFCWVQHLPADGTAQQPKTNRLDWILVGGLAAVVLLIGYQQLAPNVATTARQQTGVDASRAAANSPAGAIAIAVLPFANLSGDATQEFFSDGMTEEITAALAKIADLKVVARTSAFEFKGQNRNVQTIGEQLHATHLIEGSVRKAGERVRVTVQLIKADDGTHIWSETYDRQLTDIFAIQEDIARTITASLRMPLGLKPGENLVNNRSIDAESYQQFLRAKELERIRGLANLNTAVALLDEVVARNPGYAPAWALLALTHNNVPNYSSFLQNGVGSAEDVRVLVESSRTRSEAAAKKAIQLDPDLPDGYVALALTQVRAGKFLAAEDLFSKSLRLDPNQPDALYNYSQLLAYVGHVKKALAVKEQLRALEAFVPLYNRDLGLLLPTMGQNDAALSVLNQANALPIGGNVVIAIVHTGAGRFEDAAQTLLSAPPGIYSADSLQESVRILRIAAARGAAPQTTVPLGDLNFVHLFTTAPERVFELYERNVEAGWMANAQVVWLWHPSYAAVRKTERFKALARKIGLVEYWRAKGWPEFCHPSTGDDFACT